MGRSGFSTEGLIEWSPALSSDGKVVYFGSDQYLYAVNASTGSNIWSFKTPEIICSSPVLSSDGAMVYVGSSNLATGGLFKVNALTGSEISTTLFTVSNPLLSCDGNVVYVGGVDTADVDSDSDGDDGVSGLYAIQA